MYKINSRCQRTAIFCPYIKTSAIYNLWRFSSVSHPGESQFTLIFFFLPSLAACSGRLTFLSHLNAFLTVQVSHQKPRFFFYWLLFCTIRNQKWDCLSNQLSIKQPNKVEKPIHIKDGVGYYKETNIHFTFHHYSFRIKYFEFFKNMIIISIKLFSSKFELKKIK